MQICNYTVAKNKMAEVEELPVIDNKDNDKNLWNEIVDENLESDSDFDKKNVEYFFFYELEKHLIQFLIHKDNIGKFHNQYQLWEYLISLNNFKETKDILKFIFLVTLRYLTNYDKDIIITSKNGILSASMPVLSSHSDNYCIEIELDNINEKKDKDMMPNEKTVIEFMIDNDKLESMYKYIYLKDYEGNTVLHHLIKYNDLERVKYVLNKYMYNYSLLELNKNGDTPIDLITDMKIYHYFMILLFNENIKYKTKIENFKKCIVEFEASFGFYFKIFFFTFMVLILYSIIFS